MIFKIFITFIYLFHVWIQMGVDTDGIAYVWASEDTKDVALFK